MTTLSPWITNVFIDTLLSFQIFLISGAKFSYFIIFCASVMERLCIKGTAIYITLYRLALLLLLLLLLLRMLFVMSY